MIFNKADAWKDPAKYHGTSRDWDNLSIKSSIWITNSWVQSGGPVTTESIVRFDTWFELFEVFRKNLAPMTLAKMAAEVAILEM